MPQTVVVDTHTTCFLCLQDIPPVPDVPPTTPIVICLEEEMEICDPDTNKKEVKKEKENEDCTKRRHHWRSIFKYLNLDLKKAMESDQLTISVTELLAQLLCDVCLKETLNLSKLCLELEVLQMKVNHSLRTVLEVLKTSEEDPTKLENYPGKLGITNGLSKLSVAELVRKEIQKKGSQKLTTSIPRVHIITKAKEFSPKIVTTASLAVPSSPLPPLPPLPPEHLSETLLPGIRVKCGICHLYFTSYQSLSCHRRKKHPTASTIIPACTKCGIRLSVRATRADWIRHSRLYCTQRRVSNPPVILKLEPGSSSSLASSRVKCDVCGMEFKNWKGMNSHKILNHSVAPCTTNPPEIQVDLPPPPSPPPSMYPSGSRSPSRRKTQLSGNLRNCPKSFMIPTKPATSSINAMVDVNDLPHTINSKRQFVCLLCPPGLEGFDKECYLKMHIFCVHPEYFFRPAKLPHWSEESFKKLSVDMIAEQVERAESKGSKVDGKVTGKSRHTYACLHCPLICHHSKFLRDHLLQQHQDTLSQKLWELQQNYGDNAPSVKGVGMSCARRARNYHPVPDDPLKKRKFQCWDCGNWLTSRRNLHHHREYCCNSARAGVVRTTPQAPNIPMSNKSALIGVSPNDNEPPKADMSDPLSTSSTDLVAAFAKLVCKFCGFQFAQRTSLVRHLRRNRCSNQPQKADAIGAVAPVGSFKKPCLPAAPVIKSPTCQETPTLVTNVTKKQSFKTVPVVTASFSLASVSASAALSANNSEPSSIVVTPLSSKSCEHCKRKFLTASIREHHERFVCQAAAIAARRLPVPVQTEEMVEIDNKTDNFGNGSGERVEVKEEVGGDGEQNGHLFVDDYDTNLEDEEQERDCVGYPDNQQIEDDDDDMMMIPPDAEDPLQC